MDTEKVFLVSVLVTGILVSGSVLAMPKGLGELKYYARDSFRMPLVEKDTADWSVVDGGAWGLLQGKFGDHLFFTGHGLESMTSYTLVYYGDEMYNDVWPYATCVRDMMTTPAGTTGNVVADWDYSDFLSDDGDSQKFWLVLSSDVDCDAGMMTAWNPSEYLFEWDTL
jgi:hypothetical protein